MKTLSIYFTLLFLSLSLYSQDSLFNYLEIAAKNNPLVLQKYAEYQASLQKVPQVGSLPDPDLSLGVFISPMELVSGKQVADIRFMQMFPWFGVLKNAKDEMSLMAKAKFELFRDAKLQVFYDTQRSWFELYKVQQNIQISERSIEILRTLERLTLMKFKAVSSGAGNTSPSSGNMANNNTQNSAAGTSGMNTMGGGSNSNQASASKGQTTSMATQSSTSGLADLYRIQIEMGDLENNIALLKNQQTSIMARFNSYLNRPAKSAVSLPDTLKADSITISLITLSDSMLTNNPMLSMLQYEQQSLDARKKMVTRMSYPMVGLGVNYSLINKNEMSTSAMNGEDMIMPMITITLPIYRKKYKAMQNEADIMKSANKQSYRATANSLQTEYFEALQLYEDAQRRIKLYESQSLLTNKSLDIMIKSFSSSGAGLNDVLRIRQQTLDYEFKQVTAVVDFNTAVAWLKRLGNIN